MRILICGSRNWTNRKAIEDIIETMCPGIIIEGEAKGADTIASEIAQARHIQLLKFPAEWKLYGRGAGPIRNKKMLDEGKPDIVVAFHHNIKDSKGTADMLKQAREKNIKTLLIGDTEANNATKKQIHI